MDYHAWKYRILETMANDPTNIKNITHKQRHAVRLV
jgi:hypothetical protein